MKTLILGLGNPILSDDSIGIRIAREIALQVDPQLVDIKEAAVGGLGLIDLIEGYKKVIIIDSIKTEKGKIGQVYHLKIEDLSTTVRLSSPHSLNFASAIELGKQLNFNMPQEIKIYAVEVKDNLTVSEDCSPQLKKAIPEIANKILQENHL